MGQKDRVGFHIEAESQPDFSSVTEDEPFRIALLGDFSGRSSRTPISSRKPLLIDRDNFDAVMQKLDVGVELPSGRIAIGNLDHFHPDHIYSTYAAFKKFRDLRERLADPESFAEAARDLLGEKPAEVKPAGGGSYLDQILGSAGTAVAPAKPADDIQKIIDASIQDSLAPRQDPRAPELIRQVDAAAGKVMNAVLHHPKFQAVESAWRTAFQLIRKLETGPELKIFLLDVTKEELYDDPDSVLGMLMQRREAWAVIAGNYSFGIKDWPLLSVLGAIAGKAGAPFLGDADPSLLSGDREWQAFRKSAEASRIGLALPRVLLRLPYGKKTSECEAFEYEEVSGKPSPKEMLYGCAGLFCAMLMGEAFVKHGWSFKPGMVRDITDLPVFVYKDDDESRGFPCAEIEITEETAHALIEQGFIPLASFRDRDIVRVLMFQNIASPPAALRGRWQ